MSESNTAGAEMPVDPKIARDRALLKDAQAKGTGATLGAYVKLSGPGWLQSAITLGGGSLGGALFLGVLGGVSMLWLQLVAIIMGVIMLSAISYVTLSTGKKPFRAINEHINPALGWSWALATMTANMLWCMPQFSLSFESLSQNLSGGAIPENSMGAKLGVSAVLLVLAFGVIYLNASGGKASRAFDWFLKALVGMVVICFFGVVVFLTVKGQLDWGAIFAGFVPDLSQWNTPTGHLGDALQTVREDVRGYWSKIIVDQQQSVMIGAAATAVGINMTFLMPYSMLNRGWDKTFRGLARFDLSTGMAIPYVLVTSCVVIAAASQFHGQYDPGLLDPAKATAGTVGLQGDFVGNQNKRLTAEMKAAEPELYARLRREQAEHDEAKRIKMEGTAQAKLEEAKKTDPALGPGPMEKELAQRRDNLSQDEKKIAAMLVGRKTSHLSQSLSPLLGEKTANTVFGIGVLGMGFSTIIILMLINGYVVCEMLGKPQGGKTHLIGCLIAGLSGASWPLIWDGPAKLWLAIVVSSFGMMLLPIAYITFFFMMNSKSLMGAERPRGGRLAAWNVLMGVSVLGAIVAAGSAIYTKINDPTASPVVWTLLIVFVVAVVIGFFVKPKRLADAPTPT